MKCQDLKSDIRRQLVVTRCIQSKSLAFACRRCTPPVEVSGTGIQREDMCPGRQVLFMRLTWLEVPLMCPCSFFLVAPLALSFLAAPLSCCLLAGAPKPLLAACGVALKALPLSHGLHLHCSCVVGMTRSLLSRSSSTRQCHHLP